MVYRILITTVLLAGFTTGCQPAQKPDIAELPKDVRIRQAKQGWNSSRSLEDFSYLSNQIPPGGSPFTVKQMLGKPLRVEHGKIQTDALVWVYVDKPRCEIRFGVNQRYAGGFIDGESAADRK